MSKYQNGNLYLSTFRNLTIKRPRNWHMNRPPDQSRIAEITVTIARNRQCDGIIYIARINDKYICYDGIHRCEAIKRALLQDRSLGQIIIPVFEISEPTDGKILDHFRTLNKCIPVPDIYLDGSSVFKKQIVEKVAEHYYCKNSQFFTPSRSPRVPNENRDRFVSRLSDIYDRVHIKDIRTFIDKLEYLDSVLKKKLLENKNTTQTNKCLIHDFYLFSVSNWYCRVK